jgi:uncharacterized membrane protein YkoI
VVQVFIVATLVCYRTSAAAPRLGPSGNQPLADTSKDTAMNHRATKRPLLLGLTLAVTGAAGAAAAVTLAVTSPSASQTPPAVTAAQLSQPATQPPIAPAAAASAPAVAATPTPTAVSLDQARGIAERTGHGQVDKLEADAGPTGLTYNVSVIRADGADVQLVIDARTGTVLSNVVEQQNAPDGTN